MNQMYAIVSMAVKSLTDEEKAAMVLCVTLKQNPAGRLGYDKIKSLFTERGGYRDAQRDGRNLPVPGVGTEA